MLKKLYKTKINLKSKPQTSNNKIIKTLHYKKKLNKIYPKNHKSKLQHSLKTTSKK